MPLRNKSIIISNDSDFAKELKNKISNPNRTLENLGELHDSILYVMQNIAIFKESDKKLERIEYGLNLGLIDLLSDVLEKNF